MGALQHALLPTAAAVLLTLGVAGQGQGAVPSPQSRTATGAAVAAATVTAGARAVDNTADSGAGSAAYWTPARMRAAIPLGAPAGASHTVAGTTDTAATAAAPEVAGLPGSVPPRAAEPGVRGAARLSGRTVYASAATGRVFFHNPATRADYSCSASALNSASRQLVVTAGHCVHGGRGGTWMTKWVYVPDYHNGSAPYGVFAAKSYRTFTSWMRSSDLTRDVAMVTTWPNNGRKLVDVTGGNGITWNRSRVESAYVLGYPDNFYQAQVQMYCSGRTSQERGTGRLQIRCGLGHGASGGPWLLWYNTRIGLGYVDGITSTGNLSTKWDQSPYFDSAVANLFQAQGSTT